MAKLNFDLDTVEIKYEALPKGEYKAELISGEVVPTKSGTGMVLKAVFLVDGSRQIFHNFNIENPSEVAQGIGRRQLKSFSLAAIGRACDDTDELLNRPVMLHVSIEPGTNGYKDRNMIDAFLPVESKKQIPLAAPSTLEEDTIPF